MRIGINGSGMLARPSVDGIIGDVVASEQAGFSSYWLAQTGLADALQLLGLAGRETSEIELEPVRFNFDSGVILGRMSSVLNQALQCLKTLEDQDALQGVVIIGHADDRGVPIYNVDLSRRRAREVRKWLLREAPGLRARSRPALCPNFPVIVRSAPTLPRRAWCSRLAPCLPTCQTASRPASR